MAVQFEFDSLKEQYEGFGSPIVKVEVEGKDVGKAGLGVAEVDCSLTAGFEANVCTILVGEVFDRGTSKYKIDEIKKVFLLGKPVKVSIGYGLTIRHIFSGFISAVAFTYREGDMPLMRVTCMDIKGVMMNGNYNKQLKAKDYSGAVKEIFEKTCLKTFTDNSVYSLAVTDTPDHKDKGAGDSGAAGGEEDVTAFSVEMVNETDYEFVVRAAKKFNYEFFCSADKILFRKARDTSGILFELSPRWLIRDFDVEYSITGLVSNIEVRGVNPDKGQVIIGKRKINNKISLGSKAAPLIKESSFILQDATINSDEDANARLDFLENEISNRFARLNAEIIGIPEIIPGRFMHVGALTSDLSKKFYIKRVTHLMDYDRGYVTKIEASAPTIKEEWT